ncbi:MAG: GNAT family N-acetyltransferase [Candidatus Limnocylindria bacterium]
MTAAPLMPAIDLDASATAADVRAFFGRDRLLAAYALADLDPENIDQSRWWIARRGEDIVAAALLVEVLPFRPCFAMGESQALAELFRSGMTEARLILATPPNGRLPIEASYRFERIDVMHRMAVTVDRFEPRVTHAITRLTVDLLDDVIDLYGNASRSYFTPARLERELYFGVYAAQQLVAAAGTHVRSHGAGIAAVGNVLTRLAYRNRGMATSVTSAVTEAALQMHRDVVLNVRQDNAPAASVYRRLGYEVHGPFIEGPAVRRAVWERLTKNLFGRTS